MSFQQTCAGLTYEISHCKIYSTIKYYNHFLSVWCDVLYMEMWSRFWAVTSKEDENNFICNIFMMYMPSNI